MFACKKCGLTNPHRKNKLVCRICEGLYLKEWKRRNPEKQKQYNRVPKQKENLWKHKQSKYASFRKIKELCVEYLGANCQYQPECFSPPINGFEFCPHSFHFHHKNRGEKSFGIASGIRCKIKESKLKNINTLDDLKQEAPQLISELNKCELLCANCHMRKEHCDGCNRKK